MSEPHSAFAMHLTVGRLSALSQAASSCVQWEQSKENYFIHMTAAWIKMGLFLKTQYKLKILRIERFIYLSSNY